MGSFRFRRSVKIAPGVRLNINKKSVGLSAGVPGARISKNSDGRGTRSIGIPGTGLYWRDQTGPRTSTNPSKGSSTPEPSGSEDVTEAQSLDIFVNGAELLGQFPLKYVEAFQAGDYARAVEMRRDAEGMIAAQDVLLRAGLEDERPEVTALWRQCEAPWEGCKAAHFEFLADQDERWPIPDH
jgi:Protein of unknown function (DUF4236)